MSFKMAKAHMSRFSLEMWHNLSSSGCKVQGGVVGESLKISEASLISSVCCCRVAKGSA